MDNYQNFHSPSFEIKLNFTFRNKTVLILFAEFKLCAIFRDYAVKREGSESTTKKKNRGEKCGEYRVKK